MLFRQQYETRVGKYEMIMSELLSNAFRSVQYQSKVLPLNNYLTTQKNRARCRLNLYAMNLGILNYILVTKLQGNAKPYVGKLRINLVETICHADSQVVENVEELILDKNMISALISKTIYDGAYKVRSKKEILNSYLLNRLKEYHYALELKLKLMSKANSNSTQPYFTVYPVTKLFADDFLGEEVNCGTEFSIEFSRNVCMKSVNMFSDEINELFD